MFLVEISAFSDSHNKTLCTLRKTLRPLQLI